MPRYSEGLRAVADTVPVAGTWKSVFTDAPGFVTVTPDTFHGYENVVHRGVVGPPVLPRRVTLGEMVDAVVAENDAKTTRADGEFNSSI